jgi:hypothetical protein
MPRKRKRPELIKQPGRAAKRFSLFAVEKYWASVEDPYYYVEQQHRGTPLATDDDGSFILEGAIAGQPAGSFNEWGITRQRGEKHE